MCCAKFVDHKLMFLHCFCFQVNAEFFSDIFGIHLFFHLFSLLVPATFKLAVLCTCIGVTSGQSDPSFHDSAGLSPCILDPAWKQIQTCSNHTER